VSRAGEIAQSAGPYFEGLKRAHVGHVQLLTCGPGTERFCDEVAESGHPRGHLLGRRVDGVQARFSR
jgi:hypothetical protein